MKADLTYKGKKFRINLKVCNFIERFFGLMFTPREKARALLFNFRKPTKIAIHSYFVFFPFIALWLDDKNKIIDLKRVKPFNFLVRPEKSFSKLIEIPENIKHSEIMGLLVGDAKHLNTK